MTKTKDQDQIEPKASGYGDQARPGITALLINHILAPTDLNKESRKTVNSAMLLARSFRARLTLVHIHKKPGAFDCAFGVPESETLQQDKDRAQLRLLGLYDVIRTQYPNTEPLFRSGDPRTEIPAVAKSLGVDLIVISTHEYGWFRHAVEGSDAEKVIRAAPCPILIMHKNDHHLTT
jgi:nucleotide-binding universal stress UspA family protein